MKKIRDNLAFMLFYTESLVSSVEACNTPIIIYLEFLANNSILIINYVMHTCAVAFKIKISTLERQFL